MLSFEEFTAVSNREKTSQKSIKSDVKKQKIETSRTVTKKENKTIGFLGYLSGLSTSIGDFLEMHQMQIFYIILLILDTFATLLLLSIYTNMEKINFAIQNFDKYTVLSILSSFLTFTTFFFCVEILLILLVFGLRIFLHLGYFMDILSLSLQIYFSQIGYSAESHLLNIIRMWRIMRLLSFLVGIERELTEKALERLEKNESELKTLKSENSNLNIEIVKVKEARDSIEEMLQNYKEEVDTLNEALKIAAMDIAEVAQSDEEEEDLDQDDEIEDLQVIETENKLNINQSSKEIAQIEAKEDDNLLSKPMPEGSNPTDEEDDDELQYQDAFPSRIAQHKNKTSVLHAIMEDSVKSSLSDRDNSTFLVHEDGTFEKR